MLQASGKLGSMSNATLKIRMARSRSPFSKWHDAKLPWATAKPGLSSMARAYSAMAASTLPCSLSTLPRFECASNADGFRRIASR